MSWHVGLSIFNSTKIEVVHLLHDGTPPYIRIDGGGGLFFYADSLDGFNRFRAAVEECAAWFAPEPLSVSEPLEFDNPELPIEAEAFAEMDEADDLSRDEARADFKERFGL